MKTKLTPYLAVLYAMLLAPVAAFAQEVNNHQNSHSHAHAEAGGDAFSSGGGSSSSSRKSVTVTSDGKTTIRRIETTKDGVTTVVTETTDADGNTTTTTEGDPAGDDSDTGKPGDPWLGIRTKELSETLRDQLGLPDDQGLEVDAVAPGGPGEDAGVIRGDLLLEFDGAPVATPAQLSAAIGEKKVGDSVELEIMRRGETRTLVAILAGRPAREEVAPEPPELGGRFGVDPPAGDPGNVFDSVLGNPDLPDDFKDSIRRMQEMLADFERKHGGR